ncbi:MAG: hypothetical protein HDS84_05260 [Bacteroidales bacterium]|nr:hypothetical protein [Bacteroidales bacterium]MBD5302915.1 hypothetical protein [Bacteroides sp.]
MPCLIVEASKVTVFTQTWHALHSSGNGTYRNSSGNGMSPAFARFKW